MWGSSSWWMGRGVALAFGALILGGCGSSPSDSRAHSGAGGMSGSGDADADAGGASAQAGLAGAATAFTGAAGATVGAAGASGGSTGLSLGDSPTEACVAYVVAQCQRGYECRGDPDMAQVCLKNASDCPDVMFSEGSTRTVSGLKACAAAYATYSCDRLNLGYLPDCVSGGMRTPGQACAFNSQCASLGCDLAASGCGQCASLGELDADCSAEGTACRPGLFCDPSKRCATRVYMTPNDPKLAQGMACTSPTSCDSGLYCSSNGRCLPMPTLGMSCADAPACGDDSYCALADNICTALPGFGAPCGESLGGTYVCPPGAGCWLLDSSSCRPLGSSGSTCELDEHCQAGLSCACVDETTPCAKRSCMTLGLTNAVCGVAGAGCHPSFTCTAGKCQPRASRGLFDAACPGN